ncbi:MAG: triose-phosphate isomerase [Rhodospirillales bacterium]|nr:triose-phosphate isomerase [Rhodospirillales bacterium]
MTHRRPLIAGNWKMNGLSGDGFELAEALVDGMADVETPAYDMLICPPFTLIGGIAALLDDSAIALGAQDCHAAEKGAHTGDISAAMLADAGCDFVIVGHSERRTDHGEDDATVKAKAEAAQGADLIAVVCIGETEAQRDAGETLDVVCRQIQGSVPGNSIAANTVVAYEPVWAIGTGRTPTNDEVQEVHAEIRKEISGLLGEEVAQGMRLLYGGSMKPGNAKDLLALADVDGGLIGGASLKAEDFFGIAQSCP